jgi:hypothetical protein
MGLLLVGCTLSFAFPEIEDAAPEVDAGIDAAVVSNACPGAADPISTNILEQSGFEVDLGGFSTATLTRDTAESMIGGASASLALGAGTVTSFREFPAEASTLYTVSVWTKTEAVTNAGCRIRMLWRDDLGATVDTDSSGRVTGTNDWTFLQDTGRSSSDTATVRIQMECAAGAGTAWFDNVWFVKGNGPICGNLNCELDESCLMDCERGGPQKALYAEGFDGADISAEWNTGVAGDWAVDTSAAAQASADGASRMHLVNDLRTTDYSVAAAMTRTSQAADGAMGLSLRGGDAEEGYQCNWQPGTGTLEIRGADTLASVVLSDAIAEPGYSADATFVMQAEVSGTELSCCVQDVPGATLSATDAVLNTGTPGVRTSGISANFDSFTVVAK